MIFYFSQKINKLNISCSHKMYDKKNILQPIQIWKKGAILFVTRYKKKKTGNVTKYIQNLLKVNKTIDINRIYQDQTLILLMQSRFYYKNILKTRSTAISVDIFIRFYCTSTMTFRVNIHKYISFYFPFWHF